MIQYFIEDVDVDLSLFEGTERWLCSVARIEGYAIRYINYIFGSDSYILSINQQYLQHDYYTDIITFDQRDDPSQPLEADIFISTDRVFENASDLGILFFDEMLRVLVHGLLHLFGYSDTSVESKTLMRRLENKYILLYINS